MLKHKYAAYADIPDWARQLYVQVGSDWVFKQDAVEGLAGHLNPALEANRNAILAEKQQVEQQLQAATSARNEAQAELSRFKTPGTVVLSQEDGKAWTRYTALGDPKTVEAKVKEHGALSDKVQAFERISTIQSVATQAKLNADVLANEWQMRGAGLELFPQTVNIKAADGTEKATVRAYVKVTKTNAAGQQEVSQQDFLEYAAANPQQWPPYIVAALTAKLDDKATNTNNGNPIIRTVPLLPSTPSNFTPAAAPVVNSGDVSLDLQAALKQFNDQRNLLPGQQAPAPAGQALPAPATN